MKLLLQKMKLARLFVLIMVIVGPAVCTGGRNYGSSSVNYGARRASASTFEDAKSFNYEGGESSFPSSGIRGSTSSRGFNGEFVRNEAPQPHNFGYQSADEQGNMHYHREEADASGTVRGSYGYTDVQGLYRVVDYIADANGFRANIRTNEPGTDGKENPADVQMMVEQPPFGIYDRYNPFGRGGFGGGGIGNVVAQTFKTGIKSNVTEDSDEYK